MRRSILLAALALVACGPETNPDAPSLAPDNAANFNQPIDARGADPSWGLKIRGLQFTLERPGEPAVVATAPGATIDAHTAVWRASLPNQQVMKVSVYASPCVDAATGTTYPFAAEVLMPGAAPLDGCAGKPARPASAPKR
jgi:uncharacterized membrane protein